MEIIESLPPSFPDNTYVAMDLEMSGMEEELLHRPTTGKFACLSICANSDKIYLIYEPTQVPEVIKRLDNCIWVMHDAKFDITQLRRWADIPPRRKLWDTFLMEHILWGGYYDKFSLADLARRYLGIVLDKEPRKMFSDNYQGMTGELLQYAALDASITLQVQQEQKKYIKRNDMKIWHEIERPALFAVLAFQGFRIDVDAWRQLADYNEKQAQIIKDRLPMNPSSPKEIMQYFKKHGKNISKTNEDVLLKIANTNSDLGKIAHDILEYRKYSKRASTYGMKFIEIYLEKEDNYYVIHPDYNIIGAETGRMSSSRPNIQNIIAHDTAEYRKCFIAKPNHKLIIADYSAQEPRVAAHLSQDLKLLKIFREHKDIYCELAKVVYGNEITKKDPLRNKMKPIFLGLTYGLSSKHLAENIGIEPEEGKAIYKKVFDHFKVFAEYMENIKKRKDYVRTVSGRKIWLNPYSSRVERNALNSPIQGTSAEIIKLALSILHNKLPECYPAVAVIHDEIVMDVPERLANLMSKKVTDSMKEAAEILCPSVPFDVDAKICDSWGEK